VKKKAKKSDKDTKILDESFEIDVEMVSRKTPPKKHKPLYDGVKCEIAFYLCPKVKRITYCLVK
jgi:hypothetical protein